MAFLLYLRTKCSFYNSKSTGDNLERITADKKASSLLLRFIQELLSTFFYLPFYGFSRPSDVFADNNCYHFNFSDKNLRSHRKLNDTSIFRCPRLRHRCSALEKKTLTSSFSSNSHLKWHKTRKYEGNKFSSSFLRGKWKHKRA